MAEKGKRNQQQVSEGTAGSLFKTAIISAPMAVGGGIGISRLSKSSNFFGSTVESLPHNPAADSIRGFTNRYVSAPHSGIFKDWQLDKLAGFTENTALSHEQMKGAFSRAAKVADPTGTVASMLDTQMMTAVTSEQVIDNVSHALKRSNSVYLQRAVSVFLEDINALESRTKAGLSLDTTVARMRVPRVREQIDLAKYNARMNKDIFGAAKQMGATFKTTLVSRGDDVAGSELQVHFQGGKAGKKGFRMHIPTEVSPGVITHGATQQSKYIAGRYGIIENGILTEQSFKHEEYVARRINEGLVPQIMNQERITQRSIRSAVSQFERNMMESPEWIPTTRPGEHRGLDIYTDVRSQILRLRNPTGEVLEEFEYADLMRQGGAKTPGGETISLFPGHSPSQIANGVASTLDVRGGLSLVPEAVPYGRRPFQYGRSGSAAAKEALSLMKGNPLTSKYSWAAANVGIESPMLQAAYISSKHGSVLANSGVSSEGQMLVSNMRSGERMVKKYRQFNIASSEMLGLGDLIGEQTSGEIDINKYVKKGTVLGYSPEGRPVTLDDNMLITRATSHPGDKSRGSFIQVSAMQDVDEMKYSKVFGGAKGMAVEAEPSYMRGVLKQVGVKTDDALDAVITMDELKKNRGLHYNQMFTSLWDYSKANMQSGKQYSELASNFMDDPLSAISKMRAAATQIDKFSHETMLGQIMGIARESDLNPKQMGAVFGAVPDIFGDTSALGSLNLAESAEIDKGVARGMTQLFFEDLGGPGSGKTATIEPRMFELLNSPHFGETGPAIQEDISNRMTQAYPQRMAEEKELTKALDSFVNPGKVKSGAKISVPGFGDIYRPNDTVVSQLSEYRTASGDSITSPLLGQYDATQEAVEKFQQNKISREQMMEQVDSLRSEVSNARIATVTGKNGLLRNRLPGSKFLTAVVPTGQPLRDPDTVGITEKYANQMFDDLESLYGKDAMAEMRGRFKAGEEVRGLVGRHPFIGPYSTNVVNFKKIAGNEAIAMINEKMQRATVSTAQGVEELGGLIRMSPMVGMAGDYDGDVISAVFAGPQLEQTLTDHMNDPATRGLYEQYSIRSQVLKAKAAPGDITLRQAMAGDATKLSITEGGRLGKLSSSLQKHRAAMLSGVGNLSPRERMNSLGLLEWLEQTPISGKHIPAGQEEKMLTLLDNLQYGLDRNRASDIANSARTVLAAASDPGQAALRKGFDIDLEDLMTGTTTQHHIPGIDIGAAAQNIANTTKQYQDTAAGRSSAAEMRSVLMGRAYSNEARAAASLSEEALSASPFGAFFSSVEGRGGKIAKTMAAFSNKMGAAGKSMIAHSRPLAIGTGISLGIAALLSGPPRMLSPDDKIGATPIMKSGTGGAQMGVNLHPDQAGVSSPTSRSHVGSANNARVAAHGGGGHRISVQGTGSGAMDSSSISSQLKGSLGNVSVNSRIIDQRSSLSSQNISDILKDG